MAAHTANISKSTKGERTAQRVLDVAEDLFAIQGYDGTSLRQIAERAGIREPGLYNHFAGKLGLYEAVLHRAMNPVAQALSQHMAKAASLRDYTDLPAIITDLLAEHPKIAFLLQRAMQGDSSAIGNQLLNAWLEKLFSQGISSIETFGGVPSHATEEQLAESRATFALNMIAMFNLTIGYFLSQQAFAALAGGELLDPDNIARQKRLLHKVFRAMLIN